MAGSYIVHLDEKASTAEKRDLAAEYGGKISRTYGSAVSGFSAGSLTETEAKRLAADPAVSKVVQNKRFHIDATQDNPPSWGLDRIDQKGTAGDGKYTYPDKAGEGVTAYVIDTGVRISHKDFAGRAASGFDAIDNDDRVDDGNGHGTHVAGTVAGASHGVAKKAKIVAVRVLDDNGSSTTEQVVAGIDWAAKNHQGPSVANMSLGGGADPALGEAVKNVIGSLHRRHRAEEFKKFPIKLDQEIPAGLDVHLVLDNYATHKTPAIKTWLLAHPRFHLHFTPTGSSWLNLVERWFAELTNKQIRRGVHKTVQALEKDIRAWIAAWNTDPKPYVWTKTADEILERLASYLNRIPDSED